MSILQKAKKEQDRFLLECFLISYKHDCENRLEKYKEKIKFTNSPILKSNYERWVKRIENNIINVNRRLDELEKEKGVKINEIK